MSHSNKRTNLTQNLREVWADYGKWSTLLGSGYFWLALAITALFWRDFAKGNWAELAVDIIPTVLGLTLAAAAILTTIGGDDFRARLAQLNGAGVGSSPVLELLSNFIFAMIVQILALLAASIFQSKPFPISWLEGVGLDQGIAVYVNSVIGALGSLLLIYGILLILGAAFSIRALATVYVLDARREASNLPPDTNSPDTPATPQPTPDRPAPLPGSRRREQPLKE